MIVTSFQDFKLRGKQISQSFSDSELITSPKNGTEVHGLLENKKMSEKSVLPETLSPETITIIPSLPVLYPAGTVKFDAFG